MQTAADLQRLTRLRRFHFAFQVLVFGLLLAALSRMPGEIVSWIREQQDFRKQVPVAVAQLNLSLRREGTPLKVGELATLTERLRTGSAAQMNLDRTLGRLMTIIAIALVVAFGISAFLYAHYAKSIHRYRSERDARILIRLSRIQLALMAGVAVVALAFGLWTREKTQTWAEHVNRALAETATVVAQDPAEQASAPASAVSSVHQAYVTARTTGRLLRSLTYVRFGLWLTLLLASLVLYGIASRTLVRSLLGIARSEAVGGT